MKITTLIINLIVITGIIISAAYNKEKTKQALQSSWKMFVKLLPALIMMMLLVSLVLGLIPRNTIAALMGEKAGWWGFSAMAVLGAVAHIPSLIAFPLSGSLLSEGAGVSTIAVFITTLTMIGVVTLPLEIKTMGKKFTILRNGISFIVAVIIALIMGVIL
ncbi:MAG: permease [Candidatus Cloacimonetes bacterium]|nr:permease [Candidatus Cloacimonadota bacterium]